MQLNLRDIKVINLLWSGQQANHREVPRTGNRGSRGQQRAQISSLAATTKANPPFLYCSFIIGHKFCCKPMSLGDIASKLKTTQRKNHRGEQKGKKNSENESLEGNTEDNLSRNEFKVSKSTNCLARSLCLLFSFQVLP